MARQGFFSRLIIGDENLPDFTPGQLPKNRWELWWDTFKNRFGTLCKVNLLLVLFFLPIIGVLIFSYVQEITFGMTIPSNGNFGIGYFPVDNVDALYNSMKLTVTLQEYFLLMPAIMILGLGLAGASYVMRKTVWGEGVIVGQNFAHGIKQNWKYFLGASALLAMSFFGMMFSFFGLDSLVSSRVLIVVIQVIGIIQFIFVSIMFMYFCTQCVTYQLNFLDLVKNSLLFAFGLLPQNLFFMALALLPVFLMISGIMIMSVIGWIVFFFFGLANIILVWTVFNHYVYDKYINDRVKGAVKNRNMAQKKTKEEEIAEQIQYIRDRNTVYGAAYASRRLSSIDKGHSFTPLTATYNRNDLVKLSEEKKIMNEEMNKERQDIEEQLVQAYNEWEEMQNKGKKKKSKKDKK